MCMHLSDPKSKLPTDLLSFGQVLMPDAKRGVHPAHVGLLGRPAPQTGVDADGEGSLGEHAPVGLQLVEGAGVEVDPLLEEGLAEGGELLGGEDDLGGEETKFQGTMGFIQGTGVNLDAFLFKDGKDGAVGICLHGISNDEAISIGEGKNIVSSLFK